MLSCRRILLPAAHRVWPVLMNRMREQREIFLKTIKASSSTVALGNSAADASGDSATVGREAFLLHHLLEFMTLLAYLCGDFVNLKFKVQYSVAIMLVFYALPTY